MWGSLTPLAPGYLECDPRGLMAENIIASGSMDLGGAINIIVLEFELNPTLYYKIDM